MACSASGLYIGLNKYYTTDLHDFCRCLKLESGPYFLAFFIRILEGVSKYTLKTGTIKAVLGEMA